MGYSTLHFTNRAKRHAPSLCAIGVLIYTAQYSYVSSPPPALQVQRSWPAFAYSEFVRRNSMSFRVMANQEGEFNPKVVVSTGDYIKHGTRYSRLAPSYVLQNPQMSPCNSQVSFVGGPEGKGAGFGVGIIVSDISESDRLEPDMASGHGDPNSRLIVQMRNRVTGLLGTRAYRATVPQWSPSEVLGTGRWIAYTDWSENCVTSKDKPWNANSRDSVIYLVRPDGSEVLQLVEDSAGDNQYFDLAWSRDSSRMVVAGEVTVRDGQVSRLFCLKLARSKSGKLTTKLETDLAPVGSPLYGKKVRDPAWAHGSNRIAVRAETNDGWDLWVVDPSIKVNGAPKAIQLTNTPGRDEELPKWSKDDLLIYFQLVDFNEEKSVTGIGCVRSNGHGTSCVLSTGATTNR